MKRLNSIIAILGLAIIATAVAVVSCKKEQAPDTRNQSQVALARIKDFKRQLEQVGLNPNERSVSYMSIPDAVWNLEALFNYTYAYPDYYYGNTICYDTTLYLPVCSNDSVSLADLYVFNGQMYEAVLALYQAALLDDKQFIILDVEEGKRNGSLQAIGLHTVQGSLIGGYPEPNPPQNGPFEPGVYWYYGENGGDSLGHFWHQKDAADTLTSMLNYILVQKAPENCEYIYSSIKLKHTDLGSPHYDNPCNGFTNVSPRYCEFYKEYPIDEDYWMSSNQLNYYYFGERHLVINEFRNDVNDPVPPGHTLFQVIVEDCKTTDYNNIVLTIEHHTLAYYGYRETVYQDSIHKLDIK